MQWRLERPARWIVCLVLLRRAYRGFIELRDGGPNVRSSRLCAADSSVHGPEKPSRVSSNRRLCPIGSEPRGGHTFALISRSRILPIARAPVSVV